MVFNSLSRRIPAVLRNINFPKPYSHTAPATSDLDLKYLENDQEGIAVLGFNRPKQKNAFSVNLVNLFYDAINKIKYDNVVRVVILRSLAPGIFCAGADLKERADMSQKEVAAFVPRLRRLMSELENIPVPVIAAIDGVALGGGLEIALACDIRVASSDSKMGLVEARLAIIPGAGGTQRLPRIIDSSIAKELIYTAKILNGKEAKEIGLVNHVIDQNETRDAAYLKSLSIAEQILPNGPIAVKMAKQAINRGIEVDLNTGLSIEEACVELIIPTKDRVEGLKAFKEKRTPTYLGC